VLGFVDHNITVNVVKAGVIVEKKKLELPKELRNIIKCHNPRCISSIEQELPHIFYLSDEKKEIYRCKYCDEKYNKDAAKK
jgi:aspartate carbamoyltransferase regulatory subunit